MRKKKILFGVLGVIIAVGIIGSFFLSYIQKKTMNIWGLDRETRVEEYSELVKVLRETYPFWEEVKNEGIDKEEVFDAYLEKVERSKVDMHYLNKINSMLKEFRGFGHLRVITGKDYLHHEKIYEEAEVSMGDEFDSMKPWVDVLKDPKVSELYSKLDPSGNIRIFDSLTEKNKKEILASIEQKEKDIAVGEKSSTSCKILEERKTAFLSIPSFGYELIDEDREKLMNFYGSIEDYENLIIDLRENQGGSDQYWSELIVKPLIKETLGESRYFLYKENSVTNPYVKSKFNENTYDISTLPSFEKLEPQVKEQFSNYVIMKREITPEKPSKFKGKLWVLTGEKIYSSSENFVVFCKNTGLATLVGSTTNGDGGIDPIYYKLPHTGLLITYSMYYGLNSDGTGNEAVGTVPDIMVNEEEALKKCLDVIEVQ